MTVPQSFYKRTLPKLLTSFSSSEGRLLFREALLQGNMESYFELAEQYVTQARPEDCARSTLVMVLNTLNLDPGKVWMKPWRWYSESVLSCLGANPGMSLHEFARTALCNGTWVQTYFPIAQKTPHTDDRPMIATCDTHKHELVRIRYASLNTFRTAIKTSVRRSGLILVVNHSRPALEQTGDGHYSPVAGYHEATDKALVMDVARFKYPPFWCPVPKLYNALEWMDPETKKMRGFLLVSRTSEFATACRVSIDTTSLKRLGILTNTPEEILKNPPKDVFPLLYFCFFSISDELNSSTSALLTEIENLPAFQKISHIEIHPEIQALLSEIAEEHSQHFLALVYTAFQGTETALSPLLHQHIARMRTEFGLVQSAQSVQ